jgi:hypothetical protein
MSLPFQHIAIQNPAPLAPTRAKDSRMVGTGAEKRPPRGIADSGRTCNEKPDPEAYRAEGERPNEKTK